MVSGNTTQPFNKWAGAPFTTTPEDRIGPPPPYTNPALQANLFFRVFLGIISLFVTWVPTRLLWRTGEFGGTVFCVMLLILNLWTVINALIWRNDDVQTWWKGDGWCDIQAYTFFAFHTAFNISLFEIMRSLASKIALNRTDKLTRSERRRERITSALVIFTVPVIQVVLTYFVTIGRYNIATLMGCVAAYYPSWIFLVFYVVPTPVFAIGAAIMSVVVWVRYRRIRKITSAVARAQDGNALARQDRIRKKLYFLTLCCIIIAFPLTMALLFQTVVDVAPWHLDYNFDALHFGPDPYNIYFITFTTSDKVTFPNMNVAYIAVIAGIATFIPFGTTPEALNMYREGLLAVGLGYLFPKLKQEYVPKPKKGSGFSFLSFVNPIRNSILRPTQRGRTLLGTSSTATTTTVTTNKDSLLPTAEQISFTSRVRSFSITQARSEPKDYTMTGCNSVEATPTPSDPEKAAAAADATNTSSNNNNNNTNANPWPDLSPTDIDLATAHLQSPPAAATTTTRNPLLPIPFAATSKLPFLHHKKEKTSLQGSNLPPSSLSPPSQQQQQSQTPAWQKGGGVDTRVWATDLERGQPSSTTERGVRVERTIARHSTADADADADADGGDGYGEEEFKVATGRFSSAAS